MDTWTDNNGREWQTHDGVPIPLGAEATGQPAQLTADEAIERFVLAGNARFTLVSNHTGNRLTYQVQRPEDFSPDRPIWFVKVLTGADNDHDYTYIGQIIPWTRGSEYLSYSHGKKSRIRPEATSVATIRWFVGHMFGPNGHGLPSGVSFYHEGRCGRCNRTLTVPSSIETGFGPDCAEALGI